MHSNINGLTPVLSMAIVASAESEELSKKL